MDTKDAEIEAAPDEAVEAAAKAMWEISDKDIWPEGCVGAMRPVIRAKAEATITAALPHLEAAKDKQIEQLRAYLEARDKRIAELEEALDDQRKGWDESMAKVEADTLAILAAIKEGESNAD
jgi:hypothetical protein